MPEAIKKQIQSSRCSWPHVIPSLQQPCCAGDGGCSNAEVPIGVPCAVEGSGRADSQMAPLPAVMLGALLSVAKQQVRDVTSLQQPAGLSSRGRLPKDHFWKHG